MLQAYCIVVFFLFVLLALHVRRGKGPLLLGLVMVPFSVVTGGDKVELPAVGGFLPDALKCFGFVFGAMLALGLRPAALRRGLAANKRIVALLLLGLLSIAWAPSVDFALRLVAKLFSLLAAYALFAQPLPELGSLEGTAKDELSLPREAQVLLWSAAAVVLLGAAYQLLSGTSFYAHADHLSGAGRFSAIPLLGPALFAHYAAQMAFIAVAAYQYSPRRLYLAAALVLIAAVVAAQSRTAVLALVAGLFVVLGLRPEKRARSLMVGVLSLGAVALLILATPARSRFLDVPVEGLVSSVNVFSPEEMESGSTGIASGREVMWAMLIDKFFLAAPILGKGMGSTDAFLRMFYPPGSVQAFPTTHNEYLRFACDLGVVGLLLYASVYGGLLLMAWRARRTALSRNELVLHELTVVSCGYLLIAGYGDVVLDTWLGGAIFPFVFAGLARRERDRTATGAATPASSEAIHLAA